MFAMASFSDFISHQALIDNSPILSLMNKLHHRNREDVRAGEVDECADDLMQLITLAGKMYEECDRWKRRDTPPAMGQTVEISQPLEAMATPTLNVQIVPDLAAFTSNSRGAESQELTEPLDPESFADKTVLYLRRNNFGFAAPQGSLVIVESLPGPVLDRRLVIARHDGSVYARRFLRPKNSVEIGLTAEIPDPRTRTPATIFLPETEVAVHQVTGILFDHDISVGQGNDEAVLVDASKVFSRIEIAFRVIDDSAVPLALPEQIVLGGPSINLTEIEQHRGNLVALSLDDGSAIFKRVGSALTGDLDHLIQFESIGGLGSSQILSVGKPQLGCLAVQHARLIIGIVYRA